MNAATWILVLILAPTILFIIWLVLLETSVKIDPGTIGLALLRGKSTGRTLTPGRHFVRPWQKLMIQKYPSRELALVAGGVQQANPDVDYLDDTRAVAAERPRRGRGQLHRALSTHPRQGAGDPRVVRTRRDLVGPARREPAHVDRRDRRRAAPRSATCSATGTANSNAASPPR